MLIVAGYLDQGGKGIIQASLDAGAFDTFVLPDGMIGDSLPEAIGSDLNGSYGTLPAAQGDGVAVFEKLAERLPDLSLVHMLRNHMMRRH